MCLLLLALISLLGAPAPVIVHVVVEVKEPVREIQGALYYCDEEVFSDQRQLELYDHGEVALLGWEERKSAPAQKKLLVTKTDKRGRFEFPRVKPGSYELRLAESVYRGFNPVSLVLSVTKDKTKSMARELRIHMQPEGSGCDVLEGEVSTSDRRP